MIGPWLNDAMEAKDEHIRQLRAEVAALRQQVAEAQLRVSRQLVMLTEIRQLADRATDTDRAAGDPRDHGAIGAVRLLAQRADAAEQTLAAISLVAHKLQGHLGWNVGSEEDEMMTQRLVAELEALLPAAPHGGEK